jgi:competence protein ComEC
MTVSGPDSTGQVAVKGLRDHGLAWRASISREATRLTIWSPVLLVMGIWGYFALKSEPQPLLVFVMSVVAGVAVWLGQGRTWVSVLAIIVAGFCLAKVRMEWVSTPLLRALASDVELEGRVVDVERRSARRSNLVIMVHAASGVPVEEVPRRVRVLLQGQQVMPQIGDLVSGKAILTPVPLPVAPGAFDYGRSLFFQSIGAGGRFTDTISRSSDGVPVRYWLRRALHQLRQGIGERVRSVIPGPLGSFADALITGERAQIPNAMNTSLQASGLFHILSISGLHMAMVVGSSFWVVRATLALFPALALRHPIKKWAAAVALAVGLFYMLLADSGAATERSFLMVAVMLFAIMVDRPAISLHNLAVAAVIILLLSPEQAVAASFQMSFLAVMGLASFFEWWNQRAERDIGPTRGFVVRWARRGLVLAVASVATSLIAGTLSGIPAAYHFGRVAPYGVVANALALPIVSIAVMPMALLATLLMPFGLEAAPLLVMEKGLKTMMQISDWVAAWPHAGFALPLLSPVVAMALAFAAVFAFTAQSAVRLLSLPCLVLAAWFWWSHVPPHILVEERARTVAARDADGNLVPVPGKGPRFAVGRWLSQAGQNETPAMAAKRPLWTCLPDHCKAVISGRSVAYLRATAELAKPCPAVDVLISQYPLRRRCRGKLATIDRFDVWRQGAHTVTFNNSAAVVDTARAAQGFRPWTYAPRPRAKN